MSEDTVNHPSHYCIGGAECTPVAKAIIEQANCDPWTAALWYSAFQYTWRCLLKNGAEDARKGALYLTWLAEHIEAGQYNWLEDVDCDDPMAG